MKIRPLNLLTALKKALHDTVTHNHRAPVFPTLCQDVKQFFDVVQPFPGAGQGVAHL